MVIIVKSITINPFFKITFRTTSNKKDKLQSQYCHDNERVKWLYTLNLFCNQKHPSWLRKTVCQLLLCLLSPY